MLCGGVAEVGKISQDVPSVDGELSLHARLNFLQSSISTKGNNSGVEREVRGVHLFQLSFGYRALMSLNDSS